MTYPSVGGPLTGTRRPLRLEGRVLDDGPRTAVCLELPQDPVVVALGFDLGTQEVGDDLILAVALTVRTMKPRLPRSHMAGSLRQPTRLARSQAAFDTDAGHATVRLSLTSPFTPSWGGPTGWPRRPAIVSCCPSAPSRPSARCPSSAAFHRGGFGPNLPTRAI